MFLQWKFRCWFNEKTLMKFFFFNNFKWIRWWRRFHIGWFSPRGLRLIGERSSCVRCSTNRWRRNNIDQRCDFLVMIKWSISWMNYFTLSTKTRQSKKGVESASGWWGQNSLKSEFQLKFSKYEVTTQQSHSVYYHLFAILLYITLDLRLSNYIPFLS